MTKADDNKTWRDAVLAVAEGVTDDKIKLKKLRKQVLISLQLDDDDKAAKKLFKRTAQALEIEGVLSIDVDGLVSFSKKSNKRTSKEEKKKSKKRKIEDQPSRDDKPTVDQVETTTAQDDTNKLPPESKKNAPCKGNPQGCTRLFLGNLPFTVDENTIGSFLKDKVTHIKWITDKETGKFYGSAFVEMEDSLSAADAVAMAGQPLIGRPIKINFAPSREGEVWPPEKKVITGGATTGGQAGGMGVKAMGEKPADCKKLFIGNLSYDIDDETITKFFANVEAEVKAVRWLHHKDSGDFKGCGYVEFWNTEACEKAATLNGKNLLGRPIRIDWTD